VTPARVTLEIQLRTRLAYVNPGGKTTPPWLPTLYAARCELRRRRGELVALLPKATGQTANELLAAVNHLARAEAAVRDALEVPPCSG